MLRCSSSYTTLSNPRLRFSRACPSVSYTPSYSARMQAIKAALLQAKDGKQTTITEASVPVLSQQQPGILQDSRAQRITVAGYEIEGVSIAGQETCIIVPRCKVAFDIGRCPQRAVFQQTLLISHGHLDHIGGIPFHVSSRILANLPPSKIVVHPHYAEGVEKLVDVTKQLQGNPPTDFELVQLTHGQEYELPSGYLVRTFPTTHPVPSQGYLLYSQRKKLKAELQGKSQAEIRDLRLAGEEVTETIQLPEIAFTGDTTSDFLEQEGMEDVFRAKLLIIELTYLDDDMTVDDARERGHMHIADLVAHAHKFQNEAILLIHFSSRHSKAQIVESLNTMLPPALRAKCVPFLNGFSD